MSDIEQTLNFIHSAACIKHKSVSLGRGELVARSHLCINSLVCHFFMLLRFSSHLDMCTHTIWLVSTSLSHTADSVDSTRRSEKRISGIRDVRWQVRRRRAWRLGLTSFAIKGFSMGKGLRWRGENTDSVALIHSRTSHSLTLLWPVYILDPQRLSESMQSQCSPSLYRCQDQNTYFKNKNNKKLRHFKTIYYKLSNTSQGYVYNPVPWERDVLEAGCTSI